MQPGKQLEQLVRTIEEFVAPLGLNVTSNERMLDESGRIIAEFDVVISGQLEGAPYSWLIQCRDRRSSGPAPGEWIEQLYGRRHRFNFDRVTAVSTTGFGAGVKQFALKEGIELRTVNDLTAQDVISWFRMETTNLRQVGGYLNATNIIAVSLEEMEKLANLKLTLGEPTFRSLQSGERLSAIDMFKAAVWNNLDTFGLTPREESYPVILEVKFDSPSYVVSTNFGDIEIAAIIFKGQVSYQEILVPVRTIFQYALDSGEETISQSVAFTLPLANGPVDLEFHHLMETGETKVLLRKEPDFKSDAVKDWATS